LTNRLEVYERQLAEFLAHQGQESHSSLQVHVRNWR
jgi:hypothetical protein